MTRRLAALLVLLLAVAVPVLAANELPRLEKFEPSLVDTTKDPCTDFFQYTCSKWIAANPIPNDMPVTSTALPLFLWNQTILRQTLEAAAANKAATGTDRKIGDYWQSCMDMPGRNANGKAWLADQLKAIDALKTKKDLPAVVADLHTRLVQAFAGDDNSTKAPLFGFGPQPDFANAQNIVAYVDQGGMALPGRDYYLDDSARMKDIRTAYEAHVAKLFELAGDAAERAKGEAKLVLDIETAFAKASMDNVKRRDPANIYNKRTLAQLTTATPSFDWAQYLKLMKVPVVPFYIVTAPAFLDGMEQQIKTRTVDDLRTYLRWWVIHSTAGSLGDDFVNENFAFFGTTIRGIPQMLPLWRRCVGAADNALGEALGQAYVRTAFPPASKDKANKLVTDVRAALAADIRQLDWMAPATKTQALAKLDAMLQKIGYPDKWRDYSAVTVKPGAFLANNQSANAAETRRQIGKIGKPLDRYEWQMTPATINAYEESQTNTINFPAGILQPPMFAGDASDPENYGAIGMVIGHEIIHGFDDQGRKFDAKGNLRDWWTDEDGKRYDERVKCIVDQYTQEIPDLGVKQNGELTLGEDTADNGGMRLALMALETKLKQSGKTLDEKQPNGLTARQEFFLAYAFSWCGTERPESARMQIQTNPHSLARFRVNRPLSNMPEFAQAFGCKAGQPMVHAPRCQVW